MGYREIALDYYGNKKEPLLLQLLGNTVGNTNGNWIDTSTYAVPATQSNILLQPILTADAFGVGNYGYLFGTTKSLTVADRDDFTFSENGYDSPFTIKFKIKYTDTPTTHAIIGKFNASNYEWSLYWVSGVLRFYIYGENEPLVYIRRAVNFTPNINQIYSFIISYDGLKNVSGMTIKIDNVTQIGSTNNSGVYNYMANTTSPVYIGKSIYNSFVGAITDIEIWKGIIE